jgi:nitrite reductase/ring-hydroxylating ferredoxin subunit
MFKKVIRWHRINVHPEKMQSGIPTIIYAAGKKICLVKTAKGLFAIEEKCPHNGFSLANARCTEDGEAIVCPLHRYAFDFKTGRSRNGGGGAARVFPIEIREDAIYLGTEETEWGF